MNNQIVLTTHGNVRAQQRGIPPLIISWLLEYGETDHEHHARYRYFDKDSRKRLARDVGSRIVEMLSPLLDCYLIEGEDGHVVTVGHRYVRRRRP